MFVVMLCFVLFMLSNVQLNNAHCMDIHHHIVSQGLHYVPGPNPCTLCICDKGNPKWCKQVLCSPPQNCKSFEVGNSCCEFKCLDDILSKSDNYSDTYDLAIRLIASAVTAILSLSLLFFLIHRLRQRKIRLRQNRQINEDQRSLNSIGYITGSIRYLSGSLGYLGSGNTEMEFHYDESNVHYPLWKPPGNYFPRGEAPPPYEEAVRAARSEAVAANSNNSQIDTNGVPYTFPANRNENVSLTLVHNTHVSITPNIQQMGLSNSQCNVMLHHSNVQSIPSEPQQTELPVEIQQNQTSVNLARDTACASHDYIIDSASSFLSNSTLESQLDVHYENYNNTSRNIAPVVTVSVKKEESFPQQALNVDYLREKIDKCTYVASDNVAQSTACIAGTSSESNVTKTEVSALSCSNSWRKETTRHNTVPKSKNYVNNYELEEKCIDKKQNYKIVTTNVNNSRSSKSHISENQSNDIKYKKYNSTMKDSIRIGKSLPGRSYDKQKPQSKYHANELQREILLQETNKHETVLQKYPKTSDLDACYVNTSEILRRKDDDYNEHCDLILKQHNVDKLHSTVEKLDKQKLEKTLNSSASSSSFCAATDLRHIPKPSSSSSGHIPGDIPLHRTLPKNIRELSESCYFNLDTSLCNEQNSLRKSHLSTPYMVDKHFKKSSNEAICLQEIIPSTEALSCPKIHPVQEKSSSLSKSIKKTNNTYNNNAVTVNPNPTNTGHKFLSQNCYRTLSEQMKTTFDKCELNAKDIIIEESSSSERGKTNINCILYRCNSPIQDDVDDYRSECENCKSLSFENCNDEEGDLVNETMTLQRRPMEQGEEHSFYRTSLTLPSHTKKATRSMTLNTPRETWFMTMQEMSSSSESD